MAQNRINQSLEERVSNFWNKASAYTTNMTAFFGRQGSNRPSTLSSSNNTNNQSTVTATVRNFDLDGNGAISNDEVTAQILLDKQFRTSSVGALQARNSNSIIIKQVVDQVDTNNDGTISRHEARVADRARSTIQSSTGLTNTTLFNGLFNAVLTKESTVVTNTARTSFDLNNDGQITDLEYTSSMTEVAKYLKAAPTAETLAAARSQVTNHAVIDRLVNSFMQNLGRIEDINPLDLKNWLENIAPRTEGLTGTPVEKMRFIISVLNGLDSNATKIYNIASTLDRDLNTEYSLNEITLAYTKFKKGDYGNLRANEFDDIVVQTLLGNNSDIDSSTYAEAFSKINNIKQMIAANDTNSDGTISDSELVQGLNKVLTQDPNSISTLLTLSFLQSNRNFDKINAISSRLSHYPGFTPTKADMVASVLVLEKTGTILPATDKDLFYRAIGVTDKDNADITALNKALNDNYALTDLDGAKIKDDVLYTKLIKAAKGEISLDKYQVAVLRSNAKYDRINSLIKQYSSKGVFNSTSLAAVLVGASMSTPRVSSTSNNNEKATLINLIKTATNMTDAQVTEYQKAIDALDPDHDGKLSQEDLVLHNYYFSNRDPQYNFSRNIFDEVSQYLLNNY